MTIKAKKTKNKNLWSGIVKVQRPLFSSGSYAELLIYSKNNEINQTFEANIVQLEELFPDEEYKTYWKAHLDENKMLVFDDIVEDQDW